jgi:hypothetical protein
MYRDHGVAFLSGLLQQANIDRMQETWYVSNQASLLAERVEERNSK